MRLYADGDGIELTSIGLTVPIDAIYEDVVLVPPESDSPEGAQALR